jgi:mono/diheme cytochrome c family protein
MLLMTACDVAGNMDYQARYDPLEPSSLFADGRSSRALVDNTVPYLPGDKSPDDPALTGLDENGQPVKNFPVKVDKALVQLGQERFNIYCIPCHGPIGAGDGKVIPFGFTKPPDLKGDVVKALSNGDIFQVIKNGKGQMFSYGYRVKPDERWAIISYIRALQLKNGAVNPRDLTDSDLNSIGNQP